MPQSLRGWRKIVAIAAFWIASGVLTSGTETGRSLEFNNVGRLNFFVRDIIGLSPSLDPRLRVYAFDDKAIAATNSPELSLSDWTIILRGIRVRGAKSVIIDKMFGYHSDRQSEGLEEFLDEIKQHKHLAIGSFLHQSKLPLRYAIETARDEFLIPESLVDDRNLEQWLPVRQLNVYGPHKEIAPFVKLGQFLALRSGTVSPWIRVKGDAAIPHLGLFAANSVTVISNEPTVNGVKLPLDRFGMLPVNFSPASSYYKITSTMRTLIERAHSGRAFSEIKEGDVVILLPLMFTGNTDFVDSPLGRMPGGFVHVAIANSVLKGTWLKPLLDPNSLIITFVLIGCLVGTVTAPSIFWISFFAKVLLVITTSLAGFIFSGVIIPWMFPLLSFAGCALTIQGFVSFESWKTAGRLTNALSGLVSKAKLAELKNGSSKINREPKESVVTVMFLDVANFSATAQQLKPRDVFYHLKQIMGRVTNLVHEYGGTVDRTMGDGLLCFFGYSYDGKNTENHADTAIACAREIQRQNVLTCINGKEGNPVWPFRIGINTASAYIGDMGNDDRIDFTLIGSGVNLAQRLESACPHHSVMISTTTFDLSDLTRAPHAECHPCKIKIKNQRELLNCIEVDPLFDRKQERVEAEKVLRAYLGLTRVEERWPVVGRAPIRFRSNLGEATLIDFSRSGVCLSLPQYLAKGVTVEWEVSSPLVVIEERIQSERLQKFRSEVRWGRPQEKNNYLHGFLFADLNEAQRDAFFGVLKEALVATKITV